MTSPAHPTGSAAESEVPRHSAGVRFVHWALALFFIVAMVTGLALYWRSILGWLLPFFGGKDQSVNIHFISGIGLGVFTLLTYLAWRTRMRWTGTDSYFVRHLKEHAMSPKQAPPPETGFFNGGQKLYFWSVVVGGFYLLATGIVWWYRKQVPQEFYVVCRTSHRVVGVIISGLFLVHLYKASLGEPGTFRSMINGTVTSAWARARRPQWFKELTKM